MPLLKEARVRLDALVGSATDPSERYETGDLDPPPKLVVRTSGAAGGHYEVEGKPAVSFHPAPLPGPVEDSYGCGDSFAAGLTYGLGSGMSPDKAVSFAAQCGAAVLTGRGPYEGQLS
jgi:ribokinase